MRKERGETGMYTLTEITNRIATKEGFEVREIPSMYKKYYIKLNTSAGDRCVDGRKPKWKERFNGPQFPGGTIGIIDALRLTNPNLDENGAREIIKEIYKKHRYTLGGHIDDDHGKISEKSILEKRIKGCGNEKVKEERKLSVYKNSDISKEEIEGRIEWIRENKGDVFVLTGKHNEIGAGINVQKGRTFSTDWASGDHKSLFGCDLTVVYVRAQNIFDTLKEKNIGISKTDKQSFSLNFTEIVLTDYLQTLKELGFNQENIYLNQ